MYIFSYISQEPRVRDSGQSKRLRRKQHKRFHCEHHPSLIFITIINKPDCWARLW